jgi:hypothetical protein
MGDILSYENIISFVCYVGYGAGTRSMSNSTKSKTWTNSSDSDTDINTNEEVNENGTKQTVWIGVARTVVSAVLAAGAVIFFFGGREAKINDLVQWKAETAPKIQRMDTTGTLSFDLFHKEYLRTQERQEKKIDDLEKEIRVLERHWNQ